MGWGYYAPCIVYGFNEKNQEKILSYDFLGKYDLERYALFTNKGACYDFIYGKSCASLEDMKSIDTSIVDKVFEIVSKYGEYNPPKFMLALHGNLGISDTLEYNPKDC